MRHLLIPFLLVFSAAANGQVQDDFEVRFSTQQSGGIRFLANHSLSCDPTGNANCAAALASLPITGTTQENNNAFDMVYVDVDSDPYTWSSSSDSLDLATCATITWAGLYWAGRVESNTPQLEARDAVRIRANDGAYTDLEADELFDFDGGYFDAYFCFKDVTDWMQAQPVQARITVANVVGETGSANWCGWTLVVVYADALEPMRNLTVFDGLAFISFNDNAVVDVPISGFVTPMVGPVDFELGVVAYDGDRGSTGDQMAFNGAGSFVLIDDATHAADNAYNSTHSRGGVIAPWRQPAANNTLGHDASIYVPDNTAFNFLANGATNATIRMSTGGESVMVQTVTSVIDVFEPDLKATVYIEDLNGGLAEPGDVLAYTVVGKNLGSDASTGTFIVDSLDVRTAYVPGTLEMLTGPGAGSLTDGPGDDRGEFDAVAQAVRVRVGTGAGAVAGGDLANDPTGADSVAFRFHVQLTDDCLVLQCDGTLSGVAHIFGDGAISGNSQTNGGLSAQVDANGCPIEQVTQLAVATGNCPPVVVEPLGTACLGDDVELAVPAFSDNPLAAELANYVWTGPNGFESLDPVAFIGDADLADAGTYALTVTFTGLGCLLNSADFTLDIHVPEPAIEAVDSTCFDGHAVDFIGSGALYAGAAYEWAFEGAPDAVGAGVSGVVFDAPGWHAVALTLTELGCAETVSDSVYLIATPALPPFPVNGLPQSGCAPLIVQPVALAPEPVDLLWHFGDGQQSVADEPVHVYDAPGTYDVQVSAMTLGACPATVTFTLADAVTVHPDPVAGFELEPQVVDVLAGTVGITSLADAANTVTYWMADGGSLNAANGTYTFTEGGTFDVVQTVVSPFGCTATASGEVAVNGTIFFAPNAFTPDDNGLNEVWQPEVTGVESYAIEIYNRWGERIWWSEDPEEGWIGNAKGGAHFVPDGLYLWRVRLTDQLRYPRLYEGTIWLAR